GGRTVGIALLHVVACKDLRIVRFANADLHLRALLAQRQQPDERRDDARRTRVNRAMTRLNKTFQRTEAKLSTDQLVDIEERIADLQRLLKGKTKPKA
ncbi:MAG TPA: hypothetical protein PLT07_08485, partial [Trueperaceae bacterium]|nr:hypothetical protein [Trueperaceae bacterium]